MASAFLARYPGQLVRGDFRYSFSAFGRHFLLVSLLLEFGLAGGGLTKPVNCCYPPCRLTFRNVRRDAGLEAVLVLQFQLVFRLDNYAHID